MVQLAVVSSGLVTSEVRDQTTRYEAASRDAPGDKPQVVAPEITSLSSGRTDGARAVRAQAELIAFAPNGTVLHYNDTYEGYLDVDPSPRGESTVTYVAHKELPSEDCYQTRKCTEIALQRSESHDGTHRDVLPDGDASRLVESLARR
ncbi:hypothetical protein [Halorussus caseinilyticus]|uniref:Uncharacterized protein n=1 Tax=Halorussus caseinilyticus TaxID=3034025 RepID=A0ABD5WQU6_9EURY